MRSIQDLVQNKGKFDEKWVFVHLFLGKSSLGLSIWSQYTVLEYSHKKYSFIAATMCVKKVMATETAKIS